MPKARQNTKLESEGAEFLVLGQMLIRRIASYKSYVNYPGFDLVAMNTKTGNSARIQVKSRWATDYDKSFPIKNFHCDFVVHVALNRGIKFRRVKRKRQQKVKPPEFFVFPVQVVKAARNRGDKWGKVTITNIYQYEKYKDNWRLILDFLKKS